MTRPPTTPPPWVDGAPSHWGIARLKTTVSGCQNGVWGDEPDGLSDIACVRVADFDRTTRRVRLNAPTLRSIPLSKRGGRVLRRGDLLIEKSGGGDLQPVGTVVLFDHDTQAVCSNFVARMPVACGHDSRFLTYLHESLYGLGVQERSIKQTTGIQNLDSSEYLNEKVALPRLEEQQQIAGFLDHKTAAIDALVAKKERLVEFLVEKRIAVITAAVTKGLGANAPRRASGVEWLGDIPENWCVRRIKHVARLESGHTPDRSQPNYWRDTNDIPWVSLNDTKWLAENDYITDTALHVNDLGLANSSAHMLPARVVVFTRDATIGKAAITTRPMAVSQHIIAWVCGPMVHPEYLLYVFYAMEKELTRYTMGATLRTIGMPDVKKLVMPLPSLDEQKTIAMALGDATSQMAATKATVEKQIEHLREYRQALITAAVTGQLDIAATPQEAA